MARQSFDSKCHWDVPADAVGTDDSESAPGSLYLDAASSTGSHSDDDAVTTTSTCTPSSSNGHGNGNGTDCGGLEKPYHVLQDIRVDYRMDSSLTNVLGTGTQTTVQKAMCRTTHQRFAVKSVLKSDKEAYHGMTNEATILKHLQHENIVTCHRAYEDSNAMHLVLELCDGLELYEEVWRLSTQSKNLSEAQAAQIVIQVLKGISYCHDKHIVHRDIKLENIRYKSKLRSLTQEIRLLDFGLAAHHVPGLPMSEVVGSPMYMAPEVLEEKYDEKCDIWSIGITTFVLLCGEAPFVGDTEVETLDLVRKAAPSPDIFQQWAWNRITRDAKDFVLACLQKDPTHRSKAKDLLSHPWILRHDKSASATKKKTKKAQLFPWISL